MFYEERRHFLKINVAIKMLSARKISYWVQKKIESVEKDIFRCHTPIFKKNVEKCFRMKGVSIGPKRNIYF